MGAKPFPTWVNILYHLIPGAAITAVYLILVSVTDSAVIPKALIFYGSALVMIPIMFFIMKRNSATGCAMDTVAYREKLPVWKMALLALGAFLWAGLMMTVTGQMNTAIEDHAFGWMKDKFIMTDYLTKPELYPRYILILTWTVGLLTSSTLLPAVEEYYFRGFLMGNLGKYGIGAVILSSLLFSAYHLFSPWLVLARFVAILPMTYLIWKFRDIRIGITAHILLNLVGDSLSAIPIVFGS